MQVKRKPQTLTIFDKKDNLFNIAFSREIGDVNCLRSDETESRLIRKE